MQEVGQHFKIHVQKSPLHGWGVFADEDIPEHQFVETAPGIIVPQEILNACRFFVTAEGLRPEDLVLDQYGLGWPDNKVCIPMGWIGLYNHSDSPSAEFFYRHESDMLSIRSIRPIKSGEEITVYYGDQWWARKPYLKKL